MCMMCRLSGVYVSDEDSSNCRRSVEKSRGGVTVESERPNTTTTTTTTNSIQYTSSSNNRTNSILTSTTLNLSVSGLDSNCGSPIPPDQQHPTGTPNGGVNNSLGLQQPDSYQRQQSNGTNSYLYPTSSPDFESSTTALTRGTSDTNSPRGQEADINEDNSQHHQQHRYHPTTMTSQHSSSSAVDALQAALASSGGGGGSSNGQQQDHDGYHLSHGFNGNNSGGSRDDDSRPKKRKRSNRKEKGLDAFRLALLQHLQQHARLSPASAASGGTGVSCFTPDEENESLLGDSGSSNNSTPALHGLSSAATSASVTEGQRQAWLHEYELRISEFSIKQLVQESVRFRFPCSPFVILVPNWHALREALWLYLKSIGVKKAKRSVSTKKDLIDICIQPEVRFDFSEFVKDAESHGNRKEKSMDEINISSSSLNHSTGSSNTKHLKKRIKTEDDHMDDGDDEHDQDEDGEEDSSSSMHPLQASPANSATAVSATPTNQTPAMQPQAPSAGSSVSASSLQQHQPSSKLSTAASPYPFGLNGSGVLNSNKAPPDFVFYPHLANQPFHHAPPSAQTQPSQSAPPPSSSQQPPHPTATSAQDVIHHFLNLPPAEYNNFKSWFYINVVQRENPGLNITVTNAPTGSNTNHHHHPPPHHSLQTQSSPIIQHQPPPSSHQSNLHHSNMLHSVPSTPLLNSNAMMSPPHYPMHEAIRGSGSGTMNQHHTGPDNHSHPTPLQASSAAFQQWSNNVLMTPMLGPGATPSLHGTHPPPQSNSHLMNMSSPMQHPLPIGSPPSSSLFSPNLLSNQDPTHMAASSAQAAQYAAQQATQASNQAYQLHQQLLAKQQRLEKLKQKKESGGGGGGDGSDDEMLSSDDESDDVASAAAVMLKKSQQQPIHVFSTPISAPLPPPNGGSNTAGGPTPLTKRTVINLNGLTHPSPSTSVLGSPYGPPISSPSLRSTLYRPTTTPASTTLGGHMSSPLMTPILSSQLGPPATLLISTNTSAGGVNNATSQPNSQSVSPHDGEKKEN